MPEQAFIQITHSLFLVAVALLLNISAHSCCFFCSLMQANAIVKQPYTSVVHHGQEAKSIVDRWVAIFEYLGPSLDYNTATVIARLHPALCAAMAPRISRDCTFDALAPPTVFFPQAEAFYLCPRQDDHTEQQQQDRNRPNNKNGSTDSSTDTKANTTRKMDSALALRCDGMCFIVFLISFLCLHLK